MKGIRVQLRESGFEVNVGCPGRDDWLEGG